MAIAYVNNTTGCEIPSSSLEISKPAWVLDDQLLIAIMGDSYGYVDYTQPAGWTVISERTGDPTYHIAYKIANSEGASWTWSKSYSKASNWCLIGYSGVDTSDPVGATDDTDYGTSNTTLRHHSITTTAANAMVLAIGALYYQSMPVTQPSGYTERADFYNTSYGSWFAISVSEKLYASAGATGDQDATLSNSTGYKFGVHVALKPAAAAMPLLCHYLLGD